MLPASPRPRRVAPEDFRAPGKTEGFDIGADPPPALGQFLDEHAEGGAPRHRLQPERAGAGEQVEHARTRSRSANRCAITLKTASRVRSVVGRMSCERGAASGRPRNSPPTMRIAAYSPLRGLPERGGRPPGLSAITALATRLAEAALLRPVCRRPACGPSWPRPPPSPQPPCPRLSAARRAPSRHWPCGRRAARSGAARVRRLSCRAAADRRNPAWAAPKLRRRLRRVRDRDPAWSRAGRAPRRAHAPCRGRDS